MFQGTDSILRAVACFSKIHGVAAKGKATKLLNAKRKKGFLKYELHSHQY